MAIKTKTVPLANVEAYEKKGWVATNAWSIRDYTVVMEKVVDTKENNLQSR